MTEKQFNENQQQILSFLAILRHADQALLEHLLGYPISKSEIAFIKQQPFVDARNPNQITLAQHHAEQLLTDLEKKNQAYYRQLHEQAIPTLITRLHIDNPQDEKNFMIAFSRLANSLLSDQPDSLIELMGKVQNVPLNDTSHKQEFLLFSGIALRRSGQFSDALSLFNLLLSQTVLERPIVGRALNARAICFRHLGRLEEAANDYKESLAIFRALKLPLREGISLLNIGALAYELQDYGNAEQKLHQAMQIFEQLDEPARAATVHNEIGLVYRDLGRWSDALEHFGIFVKQRRVNGDQEQMGIGINNIGEILLFQGEFEKASDHFNDALIHMTAPVYRFDIHLNIGLAKQAMGEWKDAKDSFEAALHLAQEINRREVLPQVYYRLGDLYKTVANHDKANAQFLLAIENIEATREPIRDEGIKISLLGRWQQVYETLILQYLELGDIETAFNWAERARARAIIEAISEGGEPLNVVTAHELQSALPKDSVILCFFTTGVIERDIPMLNKIPADSPLHNYLLTPPRTILFVITPTQITSYTCPIDPNQLTTQSHRGNDPQRFLNQRILPNLSRILLAQVRRFLLSKRLYLVPHGPLHNVPFAALQDDGSRFLLRSNGPLISYAPSSSVLLHHTLTHKNELGKLKTGVAVAFDGAHNGRPLPYSTAEAATICKMTGSEIWTGDNIQLSEAAKNKQWLHFACHGRFNQERPLDSYLEISPTYHLTAQEVIDSWQLTAQLVVLSACQTGMSKVLRGDEPMGLIRAFLYAGAQTVLVTHWPVEDLPTYLLMVHFYKLWHQQKTSSLSHALQESQLWLRELTLHELMTQLENEKHVPKNWTADLPKGIQKNDTPFAAPQHWAGFMIFGD